MTKTKVLLSGKIFNDLHEDLAGRYELRSNQADEVLDAATLGQMIADREAAVVTPVDRIDASLLAQAPNLRLLCNIAVGYNNIDVEACTTRRIMVTNTPGVLDETTADLGFGLLLAAARRVVESDRWVRGGQWQAWRTTAWLGHDVHHARLGILGLGRIGQAIARRARGFAMEIAYHNRNRLAPDVEAAFAARYMDKGELLEWADFVLLCLPYSPATHHTIGIAELQCMKPDAVLVNIGRGGLVDDAALIEALRARRIAAAGLDVFENEPQLQHGFFDLDNVVLTPHIGSASFATRRAMCELALQNLHAALAGAVPPNLLNPQVLAAAP
ncbi:MAG: D-glycerate dehydrogenase [Rhodocyclaceae bacterium]|nr:D-glycerate dehydrogenase [Rhodocyclaceae bacterium]